MTYKIIEVVILSFVFSLIIIHFYKKRILNDKTIETSKELIEFKEAARLKIDQEIAEYKKHKEDIINALEESLESEKKRCNREIEFYKNSQIEKTENDIKAKNLSLEQEYEQKKKEIESNIAAIQSTLDDFKKRQDVVNQEIVRRKRLEEEREFYKINLNETEIEDIKILSSIKEKLNNSLNLDKIIYESYISKPTLEMIKRVLNGRAPSGIYKITRIKTGEIYIGKAVNIKERWTQHVKTVYNVGTIATSVLHKTMKKDGIENFTFEILEEVPKEELGKREKYWIDFYSSKLIGMNERAGG